jgi:hypothetical protein
MPNPRNLDYVLGAVGWAMQRLSKQWAREIPPIQAIVCNKHTGMPGKGVAGFLPDDFMSTDRRLRQKVLRQALSSTFAFPDWGQVLRALGLKPEKAVALPVTAPSSSGRPRGGAEETEEHKQLKRHVALHPELVGLPKGIGPGIVEFAFPTFDAVDVLFKRGSQWIGVEVKPSTSSDDDLIRGIFQCIKYQTLVEALQRATQMAPNARLILALGGGLRAKHISLLHTLGVEVVEHLNRTLDQTHNQRLHFTSLRAENEA